MKSNPLLIVSDLHLGPAAPRGADVALAALLERYRERELVCLGDLLDLSADIRRVPATVVLADRLANQPISATALQRHLKRGSPVTLVAGNHDAELGVPDARGKLLEVLDVPETSALHLEPWCLKRSGAYLEHGHLWDPDNAPLHPLAPLDRRHEPLGIALTRQVLAPTSAFQFAHAHQTTPLNGLLRALRELKFRAPELIFRYFSAGARIVFATTTSRSALLRQLGQSNLAQYALEHHLPTEVLTNLESLRPVPRHATTQAAFARLYLDRALATVASAAALTFGVVEREVGYLLVAATGFLYLALSKGDRAERYSASLVMRVRNAAEQIRPLVHADFVVFAHTHVAESRPGYVNTGSFGFPTRDGRPFLLIEEDGSIKRGYVESNLECRVESLVL